MSASPAWLFVCFAAFAIVAMSNGVNVTDGLDGLAGGTLIFAFVGYLIIAALQTTAPTQPNLAALCALIVGALLGFLWFNVHPAQIFMGDCRIAVARCDAGRDRADHRPDPAAAAHRDRVRGRGRLRPAPDRVLQAHRRQADLPDGAAPPPFRAVGLARGEDHDALLDRRRPLGDGRRGVLPRDAAGPTCRREMAAGRPMPDRRADRPGTASTSTPSRVAPVTVLGLARSGDRAAAGSSPTGAPSSPSTTHGSADQLADALASLDGRAGPPAARPGSRSRGRARRRRR